MGYQLTNSSLKRLCEEWVTESLIGPFMSFYIFSAIVFLRVLRK